MKMVKRRRKIYINKRHKQRWKTSIACNETSNNHQQNSHDKDFDCFKIFKMIGGIAEWALKHNKKWYGNHHLHMNFSEYFDSFRRSAGYGQF